MSAKGVLMRGRERSERGAVAVEFALVLPILLILLVGIISTGLSYSKAIGVTNSVREGARFGATADASKSTWAGDVITQTRETLADGGGSETQVCVQLLRAPSTSVKAQCTGASLSYASVPSSVPTGTCVVRVSASRPFEINTVFNSWSRVLIRQAVSRYERATGCT